jgi:hypothetical protein
MGHNHFGGFGNVCGQTGARGEFIRDPSLNNMSVVEIMVPAKWHFQGVLIQSGKCSGPPMGVFRATSPDGLTFVEQMPNLGWLWRTGSASNPASNAEQNDCLPLRQAISAQDFLKYLAVMLKVEYVADEPVPAEVGAKAQKDLSDVRAVYAPKYAANHVQQPRETLQLARAVVRFKNGTFVMKGRLATMVDCTETQGQMPSMLVGRPPRIQPGQRFTEDQCRASVRYISTPESQYQAVAKLWDSKNMEERENPEWSKAFVDRDSRQTAGAIHKMNIDAEIERRRSAQQFAHNQAVRQEMHEQFLSTLQRGTDMSMNRAAQIANSNHTIASDWVDYALDQQTVRDPNTGQVSKVSSSYSYTWVDGSGTVSYQTANPNANPNGIYKGNWTRQQQVHGDGSDK